MKLIRVGVDLAKNVFQLHVLTDRRNRCGGASSSGPTGSRRYLGRSNLVVKLVWKRVAVPITGPPAAVTWLYGQTDCAPVRQAVRQEQ
jgi:hypothetical protein